ncbi:hypothetical protein FH972_026246 [Carpinus fangiana]|uniref:HCP-like protein n=1 Tax=Carpinus fangiana TaxID=176857 RepID=A0A5N6L3T0_9ROSI|nr:hypothetical protein FH972_026246 [Carpinus fangiana]KAB8664822.1 hypothetical protein FH972_026246 [Carpinus fangiana]
MRWPQLWCCCALLPWAAAVCGYTYRIQPCSFELQVVSTSLICTLIYFIPTPVSTFVPIGNKQSWDQQRQGSGKEGCLFRLASPPTSSSRRCVQTISRVPLSWLPQGIPARLQRIATASPAERQGNGRPGPAAPVWCRKMAELPDQIQQGIATLELAGSTPSAEPDFRHANGGTAAPSSTPPRAPQPDFSLFPKLQQRSANVPPSDEEKEGILESARAAVLASTDPEVQLMWANDALTFVDITSEHDRRMSYQFGTTATTPPAERQMRADAISIVEFLAGQRHPRAEFMKGMWLEFGKFGYREDKAEAFRAYKRAAERGYARAEYRMGMLFESTHQQFEALQHYRAGEKAGDSAACYRLGMTHLLGQLGQPEDFPVAIQLIKHSADHADENAPQGAYVYGMLLANELPQVLVPATILQPNSAEARIHLERSAFLGFSKAQAKMGSAFELCSLGCPFDPTLSLHYNRLAARQGESEAEMSISKWFLCGATGIFNKSEPNAYHFAERAAADGLDTAEFAMGYFNEVGISCSRDIDAALQWYRKAAAKGNKDATARIDAISNQNTLSKNDHEQIAVQRIRSTHASKKGHRPARLANSSQPMPTISDQFKDRRSSADHALPPVVRPISTQSTLPPRSTSVAPYPLDDRPATVAPYPVGDSLRPTSAIADPVSGYMNAAQRPASAAIDGRVGLRPPTSQYPGASQRPQDNRASYGAAGLPTGQRVTGQRQPSGAPPARPPKELVPPYNDIGYSAPADIRRSTRTPDFSSRPPGTPDRTPPRAQQQRVSSGPGPSVAGGRTPSAMSGALPASAQAKPSSQTATSGTKPAVAAATRPPGKGPSTFEEMGIPVSKKDSDCISPFLSRSWIHIPALDAFHMEGAPPKYPLALTFIFGWLLYAPALSIPTIANAAPSNAALQHNHHQKPLLLPSSTDATDPVAPPPPPTTPETTQDTTLVALRFDSVHAADVPGPQYVELPLHQRIAPLSPHTLPLHPLFAEILGTHTVRSTAGHAGAAATTQIVASERAARGVVCVAYPKLRGAWERASLFGARYAALRRRWHAGVGGAFEGLEQEEGGWGRRVGRVKEESEGEGEEWPEVGPVWWTAGDGRVNFEDARERWWLMGREYSSGPDWDASLHFAHFQIFLAATAGSCIAVIVVRCSTGAMQQASELDGLQLSPLAAPDAQADHQTRAGNLKAPPKDVPGYGMAVEGCADEVNTMDGEGEVGHEFRAGDKEEKRYDTIQDVLPSKEERNVNVLARGQRREDNKYHGARVVGELELYNLRRNAQGREVGQSSRARWPPSAQRRRHAPLCDVVSMSGSVELANAIFKRERQCDIRYRVRGAVLCAKKDVRRWVIQEDVACLRRTLDGHSSTRDIDELSRLCYAARSRSQMLQEAKVIGLHMASIFVLILCKFDSCRESHGISVKETLQEVSEDNFAWCQPRLSNSNSHDRPRVWSRHRVYATLEKMGPVTASKLDRQNIDTGWGNELNEGNFQDKKRTCQEPSVSSLFTIRLHAARPPAPIPSAPSPPQRPHTPSFKQRNANLLDPASATIMRAPTARFLNPLRLLPLSRSASYEQLPGYERQNGHAAPLIQSPLKKGRFSIGLPTLSTPGSKRGTWIKNILRALGAVLAVILVIVLLGGGRYAERIDEAAEEAKRIEEHANTRYWEAFPRINGFYNGVRMLVPWSEWVPDPDQDVGQDKAKSKRATSSPLPLPPLVHDPYPNYTSSVYLQDHYPVQECFLDERGEIPTPEIFSYPGVPQHLPLPSFGSYEELGLSHDVCFERFGRLGPYGYGYNAREGGLGLGMRSEQQGAEAVWQQQGKINYKNMDWGSAQKACFEKNKRRFELEGDETFLETHETGRLQSRTANVEQRQESSQVNGKHSGSSKANGGKTISTGKKLVPRTAYVLRAWTGFEYTNYEILTLRAMINELALKSGGEYDVHILLHVKDDTVPIWSSSEVYQKVIEENIPEEFWGITTLWSVQQMKMYYPGPFGEPPANIAGQEIHGVYRSAHFAIQWFAHEHPEYDFVWNWEMDMRHSGHHYEFHQGVAEWAKSQPRKGMWERNEKLWIPELHGSWANFTQFVDQETLEKGDVPVWGPVDFPGSGPIESPESNKPPMGYFDDNAWQWGVGEEADLITFNPIFDPAETNWVFRKDISGYDLEQPIPPRRCAIVTVARLSRRLLDMMHEETYIGKHSAFPEMWPPTVALHHGFKAVYIPHPVYFDRKWPLEYMDQIFNYPETKINSPFGWGEHNWLGSSFYYNSGFSGALWRRWLGEKENNEGGVQAEMEGSGRMCLRSVLHHPIKNEDSPED